MRRLAVLSAALIAAATLANPVAARERYVQRSMVDPDVATPAAPYYRSGPAYYPGPRVGAFATAPWDNSPPPAYYGSPYAAPYSGY
ncbi:hypothetical protein [Bradyrhizobium cenepequi]